MAETSPAPAGSGIEGAIAVSPAHGGPQREGEAASAPVRNARFLVQQGEKTLASFETDAEGHFRVSLPPGRYTVVREGASPRIGRWRFEVDVTAAQVTKVQWTGDSGMR